MNNLLRDILVQKEKEVARLKRHRQSLYPPTISLRHRQPFARIFDSNHLAFIAELKRRSPSKGHIASIDDPINCIKNYVQGGASAISVLTDRPYFSGSLEDLILTKKYLSRLDLPVLRKDFIIDPIQIDESARHGADAVLLIVAILKQKTQHLLHHTQQVGLSAIVEVHTLDELNYALSIGAEIIGINNRNLTTFKEDLNCCLELIQHVPPGIHTLAESAVRSVEDIRQVHAAGFDGVLIGEALGRSSEPQQLIQTMRQALCTPCV